MNSLMCNENLLEMGNRGVLSQQSTTRHHQKLCLVMLLKRFGFYQRFFINIYSFRHVKREGNQLAYSLARRAILFVDLD